MFQHACVNLSSIHALQVKMAVFMRERVGMEKTGGPCTVPNNPRAKLMYYLSCVSSVLQLDDYNMRRMSNYNQYYTLTDTEETHLLYLALLLSPDELIGKVFFPSDQLCGNSANQFYNLQQIRSTFAVANSVVVGGQQRRVVKIMTFKMSWMTNNFIEPAKALEERRRVRQAQAAAAAARAVSNSCTIQ